MKVKGVQRVRKGFTELLENISGPRTHSAIYAVLWQGSELAATMTPIDTSNLVNSRYAPRIKRGERGMVGEVGYTAHYAAAVHNAPGTLKGLPRAHFGKTRAGQEFGGGTLNGNYWDPDAEPRFLEKGFDELRPSVMRIIREIYRV